MSLWLAGIGTAVPGNSVTQERATELAFEVLNLRDDEGWHVKEVFRRAGVRKRHSIVLDHRSGDAWSQSYFPTLCDPEKRDGLSGPGTAERMKTYHRHAIPLGLEACEKALENAKMPANATTHLVTISCTGFAAPGVDCGLIEKLGLPRGIARTNVGFMGCHAAFNGLRVANAFVTAEPDAVVLLSAVELCSLHFDYGWEMDRVIANALFADGAAAVVAKSGDIAGPGRWKLVANGSHVVPDTADAMTWRIGDRGFEMSLSRKVPRLIVRNLPQWLASWLGSHDLKVEDIGSWAVHPGGPKIVTSVEEALSLKSGSLDDSREILAEYGNMSSPTILFLVDRLMKQNARLPCVALGFGPGLAIEAMLFR